MLPEYHLTSWVPKAEGFLELCDQWETYLKKYQELARECHICIVPGTLVERHTDAENEDEKLLNTAYFIDQRGEVVGKYIKKNLWYVCFCLIVPRISTYVNHVVSVVLKILHCQYHWAPSKDDVVCHTAPFTYITK